MCLPILYVTYKYINNAPECAYIIQLAAAITMVISGLMILKKQISEINTVSLVTIAIKTYIPGFLVCIISQYITTDGKFLHLLVTTILSTTTIAVYSFYVLCTRNERKAIINFVTTKLHLKK